MWIKEKEILKNITKRFKEPRKGKDMTVIRFAHYFNSQKRYESLYAAERTGWSDLSYSFKKKQIENLIIA